MHCPVLQVVSFLFARARVSIRANMSSVYVYIGLIMCSVYTCVCVCSYYPVRREVRYQRSRKVYDS